MEYYTHKEIEIKESQFDKRNLYFKFTGYKMIKNVLFRWYQDYQNKVDTPVDIEDILIRNGLEPNGEDWRYHWEYKYHVDILYHSLLKIKQVRHDAKRKRGLVDDWILVSDVTHYFDDKFKLVEPNEACQLWLGESRPVARFLTFQMKSFLFDSDYRVPFKSFILGNAEDYIMFEVEYNQFIMTSYATITPINKTEAIYSFKNGYDFKCDINGLHNVEFELIKRPEF